MSNVEDELGRHLESLDPINQEVYHKIFKRLAEQEGNGVRIKDFKFSMSKLEGDRVADAFRWLKKHGYVKAIVSQMGETTEVEIEDDKKSDLKTYIIPTEELWGYIRDHYG